MTLQEVFGQVEKQEIRKIAPNIIQNLDFTKAW